MEGNKIQVREAQWHWGQNLPQPMWSKVQSKANKKAISKPLWSKANAGAGTKPWGRQRCKAVPQFLKMERLLKHHLG
jgi:hypothetical protein